MLDDGDDVGFSVDAPYLDHGEYDIGVLSYFRQSGGKATYPGMDLFDRMEVLARDYAPLFDDAELPDSYHETFAPVADLIHRSVEPDTLETIEEQADDVYAVRLRARTDRMDNDAVTYLKESDTLVAVNPVDLQRVVRDKQLTAEFLHDYGLPTIPAMDVTAAVVRGEEYTKSELGDTGNGWVLKRADSAGGKHVQRFDTYDAVVDAVEEADGIELSGSSGWVLQPFLEHSSDFRINLCGDTVTAVEQRRGRDGIFQTNLSQMDGSKNERAVRGLRDGHLDVYGIDRHWADYWADEHPDTLSRPLQLLAEDAQTALDTFTDDGYDNLFIGADIMLADRDQLAGIPDEYVADRYKLGDKAAFVTEFNDGGGDIIERANLLYGMEENMPVLHLAHLLGEIAAAPIQEPYNVTGNLESPVWRRTGMVYDNLWPSQIMALRNQDADWADQLKAEMQANAAEGGREFGEDTVNDLVDLLFHRTTPGKEYTGLDDR